jgi:hypothetical protein
MPAFETLVIASPIMRFVGTSVMPGLREIARRTASANDIIDIEIDRLPAARGGIAGEAGRTRRAHEFSGSQPLAAIALPTEFPPQPRTLTARRDIRQGEPL